MFNQLTEGVRMDADLSRLGNSMVRILDSDGAYFFGLGYRVAADLVITCAHVVAKALDTSQQDLNAPSGQVSLDAPFAPREQATVQAHAAIVPGGWFPVADGATPADLAILRVSGGPENLPLPGPVAILDSAISLTGKTLHAYGGPTGYHRHLIHLEGRVRARIGNGRWQLSLRDSDVPIKPGCSGSPVMDGRTGQIIGLIAQGDEDPEMPVGFLIPAADIRMLLEAAGIARPELPGLQALQRWVDTHLRGTEPSLAGLVRCFVDHYAGAKGPMPFAGRQEMMDALDKHVGGGGGIFVLVSGAAGRGKSALLLHWISRQLYQNPDLHLLFLPVSIRFDTSTEQVGLRLLHAQLTGLFSEIAFQEGRKPDHPEVYRDAIARGWRAIANRPDERFLLVVDGADEAFKSRFTGDSWLTDRVLPYPIPSNLTVVLAARHPPDQHDGRAWIDAFDIAPECSIPTPLELCLLSREAVGEALVQLGHLLDALPDRAGVLDALYRLTDRGDPLLVNLWVGQLWRSREQAATLTALDLDRLQPGYGGFVAEWLKDQVKVWAAAGIDAHPDDVRRVLRVLSLARGPLHLQDWLAIVGRLPALEPWDYEQARKILESAYRVVVSAPKHQGYTFVHSRLADYFQAELAKIKSERLAIPCAYLDWGQATVANLNDGTLLPELCPTYLLRHYTAHVLDAGLPPEETLQHYLEALLEEVWLRAWEELEGGYGGYLADVYHIQATVRRVNEGRPKTPYRIGPELRCALIRASICSLSGNLWPELIIALADAQVWTVAKAIKVAESLADTGDRVKVIVGIAVLLQGEERQQVLDDALEVASGIGDEKSRTQTMVAVVERLTGEERRRFLDEALKIARAIDNPHTRAETLSAVAEQLSDDERQQVLGLALDAARGIDEKARARSDTLLAIAEQLAGEERRRIAFEAFQAARKIENEWDRSFPYINATKQLAGEPGALSLILETVQDIGFYYQIGAAIGPVLEALFTKPTREPELLGQALEMARRDTYRSGGRGLAAVATQLKGEEKRSLIREALNWPGCDLEWVVRQLPEMDSESLVIALESARRSGDELVRAENLILVAEHAASKERPRILREALEVGLLVNNEESRAKALTTLANHLTKGDPLLGEVLNATGNISFSLYRAQVLKAITPRLSEHDSQLISQYLSAARSIQNKKSRANALTAVMVHLEGNNQRQVLGEVLEAARGATGERRYLRHLIAVIQRLPIEDRRKALQKLLQVARRIQDNSVHAQSLMAAAAHLRGKQRSRVLRDALKAARTSGPGEGYAEALITIAKLYTGEERRHLLREAMESIRHISNQHARADALEAFDGLLAGESELLASALSMARDIGDEWDRARALKAVGVQLTGESSLIDEYLAAIHSIKDIPKRVEAMAVVAERLTGDGRHSWLSNAVDLACSADGFAGERLKALAVIAEHLAGASELLCRALDEVRGSGTNFAGYRVKALVAIAKHLSERECRDVLLEALQVARSIDGYYRAFELATVGSSMQGKERGMLLGEALEIIRAIDSDYFRAFYLRRVSGHLAGEPELLQQALDIARKVDVSNEENCRIYVATYAAEVPQLRRQALEMAAGISDQVRRARALIGVVKQLARDESAWVRPEIQYTKHPKQDALDGAGPIFDEPPVCGYSLFALIVDSASRLRRPDLLKILQALMPAIANLGGSDAVQDTADAIRDTARWWP